MPFINNSKLQALAKILEQEKASGFQNSTVLGGLDLFLQKWAYQLKPVVVKTSPYSHMEPSEREAWVIEILPFLYSLADSETTLGNKPTEKHQPQSQFRDNSNKNPKTHLNLASNITHLKGIQKNFFPKMPPTIKNHVH